MTFQWWIAIATIAIILIIFRSRKQRRRRPQPVRASPPRRQHLIEKNMGESAFAGPRKEYGDLFDGFTIWRIAKMFEMEIVTRPAWAALPPFYRYLTLRFLARTLENMTNGTVLILVDKDRPGSIRWTKEHTEKFDDKGIVEPWVRKAGATSVGTMVSSRRDGS